MCPADVVVRAGDGHQPGRPATRPIARRRPADQDRSIHLGGGTVGGAKHSEDRRSATNCGPCVPTGLPQTRQLVEFGGLACPFWHSTARIADSGTRVGESGARAARRRHVRQHRSPARLTSHADSSFCGAANHLAPVSSNLRLQCRLVSGRRRTAKAGARCRRSAEPQSPPPTVRRSAGSALAPKLPRRLARCACVGCAALTDDRWTARRPLLASGSVVILGPVACATAASRLPLRRADLCPL